MQISHEKAAYPYAITAYTHEGEEKELINGMKKPNQDYGFISRNMADVTLKLFLKDLQGDLRYTYSLQAEPKMFAETDADSLAATYGGRLQQEDLDDIVEREMKFFILSEESRWGFSVIPVYRLHGQLHSAPGRFFSFETEGWLTNFFDGTR